MKTRTLTLIRPSHEGELLRGPNDQKGNVPLATAVRYGFSHASLVWQFDNGHQVAELDAFYWTSVKEESHAQ